MSAALVISRPGEHRLVEQTEATPGAGEVVVRVHSNGICRSDADVLRGARPRGLVRYPLTPGHEWSGTVERLGDGVAPHLLGRKVVGESMRGCRLCEPCHVDRSTLCEAGYEEAGFTQPGGMAHTLVVPALSLHVLPDEADLAAAALLEPAACAVTAVLRANVRQGESVAVLGDGVLGLLAAQFLADARAGRVTVVGSRPDRSAMATHHGAHAYVPFGEPPFHSFDVAIHTVDARTTSQQTLGVLRDGGRLICTSTSPGPEPFDIHELVQRQLKVQSVLSATSAAWSLAVRGFAAGRLATRSLITHTFGLSAYEQALNLVASDDSAVGKVLLDPRA